jgi:NADH dehydrogenase (ubiquinone) Fe-S protein 6
MKITSTPKFQDPEIITVEETSFYCDGAEHGIDVALGHPRVYLTIGADGTVDCPYCDRKFVLAPGAKAGGHH